MLVAERDANRLYGFYDRCTSIKNTDGLGAVIGLYLIGRRNCFRFGSVLRRKQRHCTNDCRHDGPGRWRRDSYTVGLHYLDTFWPITFI